MKAIIVAAGYGSRLGKHTKSLPKAMLNINGKSILERQTEILKKNGIAEIVVIIGSHKEKFTNKNLQYVSDDFFKEHEQLGSIMAASGYFDDEVLVLFSDILFDEDVLSEIVASKNDFNISVDLNWEKNYLGRTEHPTSQADLVLIKNDLILKIQKNLIVENDSKVGEFIGIMKLSSNGAKKFVEHYSFIKKSVKGKFQNADSLNNAYLTDMLQDLIDNKILIKPVFVKGTWCEIDTVQDLERAKKIFN